MRTITVSSAVMGIFFIASVHASSAEEAATACQLNKIDPAIKGTYIDDFGGAQGISATYWTSSDYVFEICSVDNTRKRIVAQNDVRNPLNAGKFSRFEWINFKNRLWYCQSVFDAPTAAAADAAPPADPTNPVDGGCGGTNFSWSTLIKILP